MKKLFKTFLFALSAVGMFAFANATTAKAEEVPEKVRVYDRYNDFEITLDHYGDTVDNLKIDNKKAIVKVGSISSNLFEDEDETEEKNEQDIDMYLPKQGTYKITFDILDKDGKKLASKKVTVYYYDCPLTIKVDGVNIDDIDNLSSKSGKITVTAAKGNKINKCEYAITKQTKEDDKYQEGNYQIDSTYEYKTFKSGSKVTFNAETQLRESFDSYSGRTYYHHYSPMFAYTPLRITYKDKYTGNYEVFEDNYSLSIPMAE